MNIPKFLGLDLRSGDRAPGALAVADDVLIDTRGSARRRPGLVRQASLPGASAGLYAVDDTLRTVAPNGTSTSGLAPAILLDYVDATSLDGRVQAARLPSGRRYLWIEQVNGGPAQFHITHRSAATAVTGSQVALSWAPSGVVMIAGRCLAVDRIRGLLLWSGIADPDVNDGEGYSRTWDDLADPDEAKNGGFAFVAQVGSEPKVVAEYNGMAAVFAQSSIQLLEMGSTGAVAVAATIGGPGTRHPATIGTMSGDLIYADIGGTVRLLSQDQQAGGAAEDTIGTPVQPGTVGILGYADTPVALYARQLGAYLLASGNTIYALSMLPGQMLGWSKWNLPVPVHHMAECRGVVYIRSGDVLYGLYDNAPDDEVDTMDRHGIDPVVELAEVGRSVVLTTPTVAGAVLTHPTMLRVIRDGNPTLDGLLPGRAPAPSLRRGGWPGYRHAIRIATTDAPAGWRCDGMHLE